MNFIMPEVDTSKLLRIIQLVQQKKNLFILIKNIATELLQILLKASKIGHFL